MRKRGVSEERDRRRSPSPATPTPWASRSPRTSTPGWTVWWSTCPTCTTSRRSRWPARSSPGRFRARPVGRRGWRRRRRPTLESASCRLFLSVGLAEEPLAAAEHDREHHQPQLVDEVVLDQRLRRAGRCRGRRRRRPGRCLSFETSSTTSPFEHGRVAPSGSSSVEETTYLGMLVELVRELARRARATRRRSPRRSRGRAAGPRTPRVSSSLNLSPSSPRLNSKLQPPYLKSSDPPGSSTTPSREMNSVTTIFPISCSPLH